MQLSRRAVSIGLFSLPATIGLSSMRAFAADDVLRNTADVAREKAKLPGLAMLVARHGSILEQMAVGVRARGGTEAVTTDDYWHIGSCGKAFTATLIARQVEKGLIDWNMPLAVLLPELASHMHPQAAKITLYELLTMRAGLPANPVDGGTAAGIIKGLRTLQTLADDDRSRRQAIAARALAMPPKKAPGSAFVYSNTGYVLLGAIAERAGNDSYDRLVAREIFEPLQITDYGFGAPGSGPGIDQPRGHQPRADGSALAPGDPSADLPSFMRPAGGMHMSLAAWHRFVAEHIGGERGTGVLLKQETYARLHARPGAAFPYAGGWGASSKPPRLLTHVGNNTLWTAWVEAYPDSGMIFLFASNDGRDAASMSAFQTLRAELTQKYPI